MSGVREMVSGDILPTPGAVMRAAELMYEYIGDLAAFDVGGATTDVHSVTEGSEEISRMLISPEPVAKRTVEGDLGVFANARNLFVRMGEENLRQKLEFDPEEVLKNLKPLPEDSRQRTLVVELTREAVNTALARHAGRTRYLYGPSGRTTVARGKDLTRVKWLIGTGGALTRLSEGRGVLKDAVSGSSPMALYPKEPAVLIDEDYIMASAGVLSGSYPRAAARLMAASLGCEEALKKGEGSEAK